MPKICLEYVWLGGNNELRSKTRVIEVVDEEFTLANVPEWNYDGSSTGQAEGIDSEIVLRPCSLYPCPFRSGGVLVLCNTFTVDGEPLPNNYRVSAEACFNAKRSEEPWFGIEQEYFLLNPVNKQPIGYRGEDNTPSQGQYYCSVGADNAFGRNVAEEHLMRCLRAGINMSGMNAEVAPGQWEYQVGPCTGIESGDQVWVSRYILERVAEKHGLVVSWHPKPLEGDWNGSGCHVNYSTKAMREGVEDKTGLEFIEEALIKLGDAHEEHMVIYGEDNELRMTGKHETASYNTFTYGRANRGASVRIPSLTVQNEKGYFEDRRPASNMDPYQVTSKLFETTCLN